MRLTTVVREAGTALWPDLERTAERAAPFAVFELPPEPARGALDRQPCPGRGNCSMGVGRISDRERAIARDAGRLGDEGAPGPTEEDMECLGRLVGGVGRGGTFEFIQVHMNRDDAFEWFGGTADIKYAVASNAADDSFDWTFGWTGRAQFLAVHQRGDDADNGIEADNNEFANNLLPRSNPQVYNLTMCGDRDTNEGTEGVRAANIRRGTAFTIRNFLVTGFKTNGFQISDANTLSQVDNGTSQLGAGVFWNIGTPVHASIAPYVTSGRFPNVRSNVDGGLSAGCFDHANVNFQPTSAATLAGGQLAPIQPPNDGFFQAVTFIGAVPPAPADDWTLGWTSYPQR